MEEKQKSDIFRRFNELLTFRAERESVWDDIIYFTHPDSGYVQTQDTRGSIRTEQIYDNSPNKALHTLASTLNSMLTSQFSNWFDLITNDEDFNESSTGKEWLENTTKIMSNVFLNSNFYVEVFKFYFDLCSLGTAIMYIEEDDRVDREVRFSTRHIREVYFAENKYGDIDTVFRKVEMSVRKVVQRWGLDNVSDRCKKLYEDKPDKEIEILHCVYPREDYDVEQVRSTELPFASFWFEYEQKHLLDESGYKELPYIIARWFVESFEVYGRSPMYIALPDIITLNRMMELTLLTTELSIKPALKATSDLTEYQETIEIAPGSVTITDERGDISPIWDSSRGIPITFELIQVYRDQIANTLFANSLQVIDQAQMTAEEVRARMNENAKAIGPTFGRLQAEFLEKLITRVYNITLSQVDINGNPKIEPAPLETDGVLEPKFISPLAKQQRTSEINGIYSTLQFASQAAEVAPQILDNIDFDEALRVLAEIQDAPASMIKDKRDVARIRQMKLQMQQQQQQQAQMMAQQQAQADNSSKMASANKQNAEAEDIKNGQ